MPDKEIASTTLRPTGETVLTPTLTELDTHDYLITLEGVMRFAYSGEEFDALYRAGPTGEFTRRHSFLSWTPRSVPIETEDPVHHRYVFRLPWEWHMDGQSVGVGVNLDAFVNEFLIRPSEVSRALSGELKMTVLQSPGAPVSIWPMAAAVGVPGVLALGGVGWVLRRRMARSRFESDILDQLDRIDAKRKAALAAAAGDKGRAGTLRGQINSLAKGAQSLATQAQRTRSAKRLADRLQLETDAARLQSQLTAPADDVLRAQLQASLAEKHKSLEAVERVERAEILCMMRLGRIEASLEAACLSLRAAEAAGQDHTAGEMVRQQLQSEVAAVYEVAREAEAVQSLTLT